MTPRRFIKQRDPSGVGNIEISYHLHTVVNVLKVGKRQTEYSKQKPYQHKYEYHKCYRHNACNNARYVKPACRLFFCGGHKPYDKAGKGEYRQKQKRHYSKCERELAQLEMARDFRGRNSAYFGIIYRHVCFPRIMDGSR